MTHTATNRLRSDGRPYKPRKRSCWVSFRCCLVLMMSLRPMWRRRGCGGRMSGGSGEEWEGMLGPVWEIESYCFVVWWCGLWGRGPRRGGGEGGYQTVHKSAMNVGERGRERRLRWRLGMEMRILLLILHTVFLCSPGTYEATTSVSSITKWNENENHNDTRHPSLQSRKVLFSFFFQRFFF